MFEKNKLKRISGSKIKRVTYFGVELWIPEDFYDIAVKEGSVIFHLQSVKRGYQLHAIAGSRATISKNISLETFYENVTTSMLKLFGKNPYPVTGRNEIESKAKNITTQAFNYDFKGIEMQVYYIWIYFEKTQNYVLLYATGPACVIETRYEEIIAVAKTVKFN